MILDTIRIVPRASGISLQALKPQKIGKYLVLVVGPGANLAQERGACASCRRSLPLSMFGLFKGLPEILSRRVKPASAPLLVLHAVCKTCIRRQSETILADHAMYTPEIDSFFARLWLGLRKGAESREIPIAITKDDVMRRYFDLGGRCEATGVLLKPFASNGVKNRLAPSIDRIDSALGYRLDNIQVVARIVNIMKNDMSMSTFTTWCKRVAMHQAIREEELLGKLDEFE